MPDFCQYFQRSPAIFTRREESGRFDKVEKVMRNAPPLFRSGFAGSDIEAAIDLRRIAGQNLSAKPFRQGNGQRRFARGRRAKNYDHGRERLSVALARGI